MIRSNVFDKTRQSPLKARNTSAFGVLEQASGGIVSLFCCLVA